MSFFSLEIQRRKLEVFISVRALPENAFLTAALRAWCHSDVILANLSEPFEKCLPNRVTLMSGKVKYI